MPQLGMVQETGKIAAWRKSLGDTVEPGDVLMEVETDKAVVEVEAVSAGILQSIRYEAGVEIPVGSVVALIGDSAGQGKPDGSGDTRRKQVTSKPAPLATDKPGVAQVPAQKPTRTVSQPSLESADRILASPKARSIASQHGVVLQELRNAGLPEPYHASDVKSFRARRFVGESRLHASAGAGRLLDFVDWVGRNSAGTGMREVLCATAAGAWREVHGAASVIVSYRKVAEGKDSEKFLCDGSVGDVRTYVGEAPALLELNDLSGTHVVEYEDAKKQGIPTLTISHDGETCKMVLRYDETKLPLESAVAYIDAFAHRVLDARLLLL